MADDLGQATRAEAEVLRLWPEGPPTPLPPTPPEAVFRQIAGNGPITDMYRNVSEASLTVVRPAAGEANGAGVVVCPGGGWRILAWEHEGMDVARWFAARGVTAFVLKYRLLATPESPERFMQTSLETAERIAGIPFTGRTAPRSIYDLAAEAEYAPGLAAARDDGVQALKIARGAEFGLDPGRVGMIGFSAGAFLVVDAALAADPPPAFLAPIYGGQTHGLTVGPDAPPLFTCIAQDDKMLYRVVERLYSDWCDADRPAELHIFQKGGHGFGTIAQNRPVDRWMELLEAWLKDLAIL
ncbi:MAG TPA: alpha/beta hydrolase [Caulobacteraceae bacterium]|jgi:acetyl esterase/lipase|nr:alpha/beta hydrolase [Caulobacteraceae bacterium]